MSTDKYYNKYKPTRNKLRKLGREKVIPWIIERLHDSYWNPPPSRNSYYPWQLLLLLKWAFANCPSHSQAKNQNPTEQQMFALMKGIYDFMDNSVPFLKGNGLIGINKFVRMIGFQQFWMQHDINAAMIGRHIKLFRDLDCKYPIDKRFYKFSGIQLDSFFELSFATNAFFMKRNGAKPRDLYVTTFNYNQIYNTYENSVIENFLEHLSMELNEASAFSKEHTKSTSFEKQCWERTPFVLSPFLKANERYYLYSPHLLPELMRYHVYDFLRQKDSRAFSQEFGKTFEAYLSNSLDSAGQRYFTESELKEISPCSKAVDFIVPLDGITLLVESKAIEMSPAVRASPTQQALARSLKSTIIKAYIQVYEYVHGVKEQSVKPSWFNEQNEYHAFIVTFKELYLIDGLSAWEEFVKDEVQQELESKGIDLNIIKPINFHYLSVDAWDKFIYLLGNSDEDIPLVIRSMVTKNWETDSAASRNYQTSKLTASMHLDEYEHDIGQLPYLEEPFKRVMETLKSRFKDDTYRG